jgi:hypothetical protein
MAYRGHHLDGWGAALDVSAFVGVVACADALTFVAAAASSPCAARCA